MKYIVMLVPLALFVTAIAGCSTTAIKGRVVLDSSTAGAVPDWVRSTQISTMKGDSVQIRTTHTVRGDERINACLDLAKLDAQETLLQEIASDVKGRIDAAHLSMSEQAEQLLGKVRSSEYKGQITGLRFTEQYYERYVTADVERINCFILSEISKQDYGLVKQGIISQLASVDSRIKNAILKKQLEFFGDRPVVQLKVAATTGTPPQPNTNDEEDEENAE